MKEFINECMFFKSKDKELRIIGALMWFWIACVVYLIWWAINM
ncbi:hypothetical protein JOE44_001953 [Chryseobacterium sp. PvR013]|nr:hypothetical protein [Chryseobacterium sp. PvR013]